jgi:hypothetical protein
MADLACRPQAARQRHEKSRAGRGRNGAAAYYTGGLAVQTNTSPIRGDRPIGNRAYRRPAGS